MVFPSAHTPVPQRRAPLERGAILRCAGPSSGGRSCLNEGLLWKEERCTGQPCHARRRRCLNEGLLWKEERCRCGRRRACGDCGLNEGLLWKEERCTALAMVALSQFISLNEGLLWKEERSRPRRPLNRSARCLNEGLLWKEERCLGVVRVRQHVRNASTKGSSGKRSDISGGRGSKVRISASTKGSSGKRSDNCTPRRWNALAKRLNEGLLWKEERCHPYAAQTTEVALPQRRAPLERGAIFSHEMVETIITLPHRRAPLERGAIGVGLGLWVGWWCGLNEGLLWKEERSRGTSGAQPPR